MSVALGGVPWRLVVEAGVAFGLLVSAGLGWLIVASLRFDPEIWRNDLPAELKAALPPQSRRARRRGLAVAALGLLVLGSAIGWLVRRLEVELGAFPGLLALAVALWIGLQLFNLVDLLLIDLVLVEWIRPRWVLPPGAEAFADRRFVRDHLVAFVRGAVGITVASLVIAGVIVLTQGVA